MNTKIFFSMLVAAIISMSAYTVVNAAPAAPGRNHIMQRIMSELDLSDDQLKKIKSELRAEKDNIEPLLIRLHDSRKQLRETIQENAKEATIRAAHANVAAVEADLAVQRAKIRGKIVPHLTEEQLQKMKAIEAKLDEFAVKSIRNLGERLEK